MLILVGIFLICKLETMKVFGYLWSNRAMWLTEKQRQNRTMTLQHPPPAGEAAAKAIWHSPESLYILISSKDKSYHQAPMGEGGEAGTETLLLFCASQRQHWAVRPLLPHRQCSVVEPCSSQVQDKHGLGSCFCSTILINSSWEFWLANNGNYQSWHSKPGRYPQVSSKVQIRSVDVSI